MNFFEAGRRVAIVAYIVITLITIAIFLFSTSGPKEDAIVTLSISLGCALCIFVFTKSVGWIIRGLLGIPNGQDFKPVTETIAGK